MRVLLVFVGIFAGASVLAAAHAPTHRRSRTYTDPAAYCRAIGTVDAPGSPYRGPRAFPAALRAASLAAGQADLLSWRCMDGRVWACAMFSTMSCLKAPWTEPRRWDYVLRNPDVRAECRRMRNEECVGGTHCITGCAGGVPRINRSAYPIDRRGFARADWRPVP